MSRKKKTKVKSQVEPSKVEGKTAPLIEPKSNIYDSFIKGKEFYYLLGIIAAVCFFVFKDFIYLKKVYLFTDIGSDSVNAYYPWLASTSDYLKTEGSLAWSFDQGMGQNLFPFSVGDPFSVFLTYFDKSTIPYAIVYMELLKIALTGIVFYKFLKELKLSNYSSLLFSFLFAFSGFVILGGCWTVFSIEAVYLSIILYGFERWLNHKEILWFVIGLALMSFFQPFFLFVYAILLSAYIVVRYFDVKDANVKAFSTFLLKTVGLATLAVFMSSYQLFADILQYTESPRVGGDASFFAKLQGKPIFELADEVLRFTTIFRSFGSDMLGTGSDFKGWQNYMEAPNFYCGILCLLTFPLFFSTLTKKQKYFYGTVTLLFVLPIFFPFFRYAFWAFSGDYFRTFSLVIVFFMILYSARAISYIEETGKLNKIVLAVTVLFLLFLLNTPNKQFEIAINKHLRLVVSTLILVYSVLLIALSQKSNFKGIAKLLILLICFFEIAYFSGITVNKRDVITQKMLNNKIGYNDYTVDAVAYLKKTDSSFFRINKDYASGLAIHSSTNDAKAQDYYGTSSYFSFNQKNYIKFLGDLDVIDVNNEIDTRWARGLGGRFILFSMVSGKYWLSKRTDNAVARMGFDSVATFGDVKVYSNKYALPFGYTYDKIIGEDDFKKMSSTQKDFCLLRSCVIGNEDAEKFSSFTPFDMVDTLKPLTFDNYLAFTNSRKEDVLNISKFSENKIVGTIDVAASKILFFSIPFDEGWSVKVNGGVADLYRVNAGLTGMLIEEGTSNIELTFEPRLKRAGAIVSIISILAFAGLFVINNKRNKLKEAA